jgi:hypothetical protein
MTGFFEEPAPYTTSRMDKAAFLRWNRDREGARCELKDGEVVMHAGSTRRHAWLAHRFAAAISNRLDETAWAVGGSDIAIEIGETIRYSDVTVERWADDGREVSTVKPVLLVEVLSPSSAGRDLRLKAEEYLGLASLEASQDEPICWVWLRSPSDKGFPRTPVELTGRDAVITVPALALSLPLAEIHRGVGAAR